jgi:hypothetical protein
MDRRQMMKVAGVGALMAAGTAVARTAAGQESAKVVCCDCVENRTDQPVLVYLISRHGQIALHIQPGKKAHFQFTDDGKLKVLAAFTLQNDLVTTYPFMAVANPSVCLLVQHDLMATEKFRQKREAGGREAMHEASNAPV